MEIIIQKVICEQPEDLKLIEVQKKINEIREDNKWGQIILDFQDGKMKHWSYKIDTIY